MISSNRIKVGVIFGGQSTEHEISNITAESVLKNIDIEKYNIVMIGITKAGRWLRYDGPLDKIGTGEWQQIAEKNSAEVIKIRDGETNKYSSILNKYNSVSNYLADGADSKKIDIVFPLLHGCNGEDGTMQGLLELADVPYVGSGVLASALGMDKAFSRIVFDKVKIPQCKYLTFTRKQINNDIEDISDKVEKYLEYPCFIKPSNAGSSVGVSKAHDRMELNQALKLAAVYDRRVLAEEFINGREIECAILGNDEAEAAVLGEVIPGNEFYDYNAKYLDDNSKIIIPADLPADKAEKIKEYAIRAFKALDCSGLARVDFFVHKDTNEIFINEINTMPGFTGISMYPRLWEASGLTYPKLISRLLELAAERYEDKKRQYD